MSQVDELLERNARFAKASGEPAPALPRLRTLVITCADQRVDPAQVLGLELGDALVIRNGGGRVTPAVLQNLAMLAAVGRIEKEPEGGFEIVLMQHTDCGVARLQGPEYEELLGAYFGIPPAELPSKSIADPRGGIRADIEALASNPLVPGSLSVTGLV